MGFFRRRAEKRELRDAALALQPELDALHAEIDAGALAVRTEFGDLPGFPPICESCDRVMVYLRVKLGRKKWRWMWHCYGCGDYVYDAAFKKGQLGAG
jgi:hypothetical protein